jgi:prepilin signal peptidase PulO-like enzyme (type II secretory pathway)
MLIIPAVLIFSLVLAFNLPALYASARIAAEASAAETQAYPDVAPIRPLLAAVMLCGGVFPAWLMTHNPAFVLFVLLLASAAYIDCVTQWVPDLIIFLLTWLALTTLLPGGSDAIPALTGAGVMLLPALLLNLITWIRSQPPALASGDLYVLPAIGAWLTPTWSGVCLAMSLVLTAIAGRFVRGVPFITVLYPVFVAVSLCGAL